MGNSFVIALAVAIYNLVVGTLAGYSYSRFKFFGSRLDYLLFLGSRGLPTMASDRSLFRHLPQPAGD